MQKSIVGPKYTRTRRNSSKSIFLCVWLRNLNDKGTFLLSVSPSQNVMTKPGALHCWRGKQCDPQNIGIKLFGISAVTIFKRGSHMG
ncbi:MAG: hypothetical protein O7D30_11560, partial [Rickettsia endosymbiont of Ixodes persulcatus]|nr:hypothetical protein [Rickettsia endosymbiont of Ixodes persulcatus]